MSDSSAVVQSVLLEGFTLQGQGSQSYIAYTIVVKLSVQSWKVNRRYSEFVSLAQTLKANSPPLGAGKEPPAALPPKKSVQHTWGILSRSKSAESQSSTAEERLPELRAWIKSILDAQDESWRVSTAFRKFLDLPDHVSFGHSKVSTLQQTVQPRQPRQQKGTRTLPSASSTPAFRRPNQNEIKGVETDDTRGLDDRELLDSQQAQLSAQDAQLGNLVGALRRQREMGLAINQELAEQSEMLQQLDTEVDSVQGKMRKGEELMSKLNG